MIRIETEPWRQMVEHARSAYPNECCGAMIGSVDGDGKDGHARRCRSRTRTKAPGGALRTAAGGSAEGRPEARSRKMDLVGIYHSHPDCGAYFSETDLKNSCPWYSFVVLSIQKGEFDHANSWLPNPEQTAAEKEELSY